MLKNTLLLLLTTLILTIIATSTSATNWIEHNSTGGQDWSGVASSNDGTKLVAVTYGEYAWTSTDSGTTWTEHINQAWWSSVASSGDGTKIIGGIYGGNDFLISNDSGLNWFDQNGAMSYDWYDVDISIDGKKMVAFANEDNIFISNDTGITWSNTGQASGTQGAMSGDGLSLGTVIYGGDLFTSTNFGTTWTDHTELGSQSWVGVSISETGSRIVVANNPGYVFISDDYGATWLNHSVANYLNGLAMSRDGSTIGVWQAIGNIFISTDSGITWINQTELGERDWSTMAFSYNGSNAIVAGFNDTIGHIWTYTAPILCTPSWTCNAYNNCTFPATSESCNSVTDTNNCNITYAGNYTEFTNATCTYTNCTPNWVCNGYAACDYNNTITCNSANDTNNCNVTYTGNYTEFNTTYCIYCTPTWLARTGGAYDCASNNTRLQYYDDTSACCSLSPMNCIYPIDHNTLIPCDPLTQDMTCQYDQAPYLQAKINFDCILPNGTDNASCITYVRKANQTLLIQSSPEYASVPNLMFWKENEPRTAFASTNTLVNAYYTDKNLQTGQEFILGMKCSITNGTVLTSEYYITPTYQPPTAFLNRLAWAGDNLGYIIIWALGIFLLILLAAWGLKKLRGR